MDTIETKSEDSGENGQKQTAGSEDEKKGVGMRIGSHRS